MSKFDQCCRNCRFYDDEYTDAENRGECKRYPPQGIILEGGESPYWYSPEVFHLDQCGE